MARGREALSGRVQNGLVPVAGGNAQQCEVT